MSSDDLKLEWMVRRYRQLAATKSEIEAEMSAITSEVNELVDVGWSIIIDGVPASKRNGRRQFSLETAVTFIHPEDRDAFKATVFDVTRVREYVEAKGLLEQCMEDAGRNPSVVLR